MASNFNRNVGFPDRPVYANKLVFATDMVNYILINKFSEVTPLRKIKDSSECYPGVIIDAFTDNIKKAVQNISLKQDSIVFSTFFDTRNCNQEAFNRHAANYINLYYADHYNPRTFLRYSVSLALLSGYFAMRGLQDAPATATNLIKLALPEGFMTYEICMKLDMIAESYCKVGHADIGERIPRNTLAQNHQTVFQA